MPRPQISEIRNVTMSDFQKSYTWELSFLRTPSFINIPPVRFNMQVLTTEVPKKTNATATLMMRGNQIFDPGISSVSGMLNLTFVETVDAQIRSMIDAWQEAIANKSGTFNELTADFRLVSLNNQDVPNYEYWILWAYLEDQNINTLDGGTSDPMAPTASLRYTDYKSGPLAANIAGGTTLGG